jgi:DNA helicase-2/ATP-dependent DNA helicase PcrA
MNAKEFIEKADLNQEKKEAIKCDDSTIVIANPGTGKTLLLAYKYVYLLYQGVEPKDILCLTFTEKACQEMQERILKLIEKEKVKIDISQINIQTFHAFSLDNLEDSDIISSNLLRYEIYSYLIKNEVLNYSENYLLDKIVPKIENSIRYLKSFGITPDKLEIDKIKSKITKFKNFEKEELEKYLEHFVKIFDLYEKYKEKKGLDYTDLLINFSKLKIKPLFKWVLVDELQDVNDLEADIALLVGEKYLVVGDKKQAIFGFQVDLLVILINLIMLKNLSYQ